MKNLKGVRALSSSSSRLREREEKKGEICDKQKKIATENE